MTTTQISNPTGEQKKSTFTVIVIDNETGKTKASVETNAVIVAALEEKSEHSLSVRVNLYRNGHEVTPQDVIDAACSIPKMIKQAVGEATKPRKKK